MKENNEYYIRLALEKARENIESLEGGPFGAVIVKEGEVLAVEKNRVLSSDATAHAEVNAIRRASEKTGSFDLSGSVIYATTEPCPMCFSAIHWARIGKIVYGSSISDAAESGFNELKISNDTLKRLGGLDVEIVGGVAEDDCRLLFAIWREKNGSITY